MRYEEVDFEKDILAKYPKLRLVKLKILITILPGLRIWIQVSKRKKEL